MTHDTDPTVLDPSVEAYIARMEVERHRGEAPAMDTSIHGAPKWAEANDLSNCGHAVATLSLNFGKSHRVTAYMPVPLAVDLANAINAVLARHAGFVPAGRPRLVELDHVEARRERSRDVAEAGDQARELVLESGL